MGKTIVEISGLPDEILLKILSFLPTKVAVSTSILSKRWESLWMWLPKLMYECESASEGESLGRFLDLNLPLHKAPVIKSFYLHLNHCQCLKAEDIKLWIVIAVSRHLGKLKIDYLPYSDEPNILPSSLYTCESLVLLKLSGTIRLDVHRKGCLPSLKTLELSLDKYFDHG